MQTLILTPDLSRFAFATGPWTGWHVDSEEIPLERTLFYNVGPKGYSSYESDGYEPYFLSLGAKPDWAQHVANAIRKEAFVFATECLSQKHVLHAVRQIANPRCRPDLRQKFILDLFKACERTRLVERMLKFCAIPESEFYSAVYDAKNENPDGLYRLKRHCEFLATIKINRGRKAHACSVAHEIFLHVIARLIGPRTYTYAPSARDFKGDYDDEPTLATRDEFENQNFSPVRARQRMKNANTAGKK